MKPSESTSRPLPGPMSFTEPEIFPTGLSVELADLPVGPDFRLPFEASRFTVAPGGQTLPDNHAVAECWFVASGDARLVYDNEEISLGQGDIVVFAPNKTHQAFNDGAQDLHIFSTWWNADDRP